MNSTVSQHHFPALLGTSKVFECQFKFGGHCKSLAQDINQTLKILPYWTILAGARKLCERLGMDREPILWSFTWEPFCHEAPPKSWRRTAKAEGTDQT